MRSGSHETATSEKAGKFHGVITFFDEFVKVAGPRIGA